MSTAELVRVSSIRYAPGFVFISSLNVFVRLFISLLGRRAQRWMGKSAIAFVNVLTIALPSPWSTHRSSLALFRE